MIQASFALLTTFFLGVFLITLNSQDVSVSLEEVECNEEIQSPTSGIIVSAYFIQGVDAQRPNERRLTIAEYGADFFESIVRTGNKAIVFTDDEHVTKDPAVQRWMQEGNIEFLIREIDPLQAPHNQRFRLYQEYLNQLPMSERPSFLMFSDLDVTYARDPFEHMKELSVLEIYSVFALFEGYEANEWEGNRQTACFGDRLPPGYDDHRGTTPHMYYNCGSWGGRYHEAMTIIDNMVSILFEEGDIINPSEFCDQPAFNQAIKRISPYTNIYSSTARTNGLFAPFNSAKCPMSRNLHTIYHKSTCPKLLEKIKKKVNKPASLQMRENG
eukprot:CFRG4156T1